jgi:hypothetical protein
MAGGPKPAAQFINLTLSLPGMSKRLIISFFLLLAFAVVQAHDYIPHSHHTKQEDPFEHHDDGHDSDHDDTDHDFLTHAFAHFQHDQGSAFSYVCSQKCDIDQKASFVKDYTSFLTAFILNFFDKQQSVYLPPRFSVPLHFYQVSFDIPRRGPPAFTA